MICCQVLGKKDVIKSELPIDKGMERITNIGWQYKQQTVDVSFLITPHALLNAGLPRPNPPRCMERENSVSAHFETVSANFETLDMATYTG